MDEKQRDQRRILDNIYINLKSGCWEWTLKRDRGGYGIVKVGGRGWLAHRYSFLIFKGEIPAWCECLDHMCENRCCVNPEHLMPSSFRDNILRGKGGPAVNARKTKCKNGHPLSGANLYTHTRKDGVGTYRACRECVRSGKRILYAKKKKR